MKPKRVIACLAVLLLGVSLGACSGVRPLQKGETVRCPSCGAEFKVEEGMKHGK